MVLRNFTRVVTTVNFLSLFFSLLSRNFYGLPMLCCHCLLYSFRSPSFPLSLCNKSTLSLISSLNFSPLTSHLLNHYLPLRRLSTRAGEYLCKLHVFKQIVKNFIPKTFAALESIEGLDNKFLNLMFMDFFKTLLPKTTVLRIVDSYLLEVTHSALITDHP
jgi:hypothetical protein